MLALLPTLPRALQAAPGGAELETLLGEFWAAPTIEERDVVAGRIVAGGASFDEIVVGQR